MECCKQDSKNPSCDPCKINPGGEACCNFNPFYPSCNPCKVNPGSKACCKHDS